MRDKNVLYIILLGVIFFFPFLGGVHLFDWDEINFAEIAREMVITGDYLRPQINYQMFTEKPPMFMWFQALSMNIFGMNEFGARFPNAIAGVVVLWFLYRAGRKIYNRTFGWLWAGAYFGSILPHLYFKSGIIDPWFNFFIFLGLFNLILFSWDKNQISVFNFKFTTNNYLNFAGLFTGIAILIKGPVALLIIGLCLGIYWILNKFKMFISVWDFTRYLAVVILTCLIWFGVLTILYGTQFVVEFTIRQWELLVNQDAGHGGFLGYHFVVLLIGVFPASIFTLRGLFKTIPDHPDQMDFKKWMVILFWVVLILFSIVNTKIVHYSSLAYYPMTFLAALVLFQIKQGAIKFTWWMAGILLFISLTFGGLVIALPWIGNNLDLLKPMLAADPFAVANLDALNVWSGYEVIPGVILIGSTLIGILLLFKAQVRYGAGILFLGTAIFVFSTLVLIINNIESITQRAAIEFYKSKADCNCYVVPEEYKSYAQLFYAQVKPGLNPKRHDINWLKTGDIDKDVYFVAKITGTNHLKALPDVEFLYEENGFTFWLRKAKK